MQYSLQFAAPAMMSLGGYLGGIFIVVVFALDLNAQRKI